MIDHDEATRIAEEFRDTAMTVQIAVLARAYLALKAENERLKMVEANMREIRSHLNSAKNWDAAICQWILTKTWVLEGMNYLVKEDK